MAADVSFDDAVKFHRQGRIQEAEQVYRRILDAEPNHAGACTCWASSANSKATTKPPWN